jgi:UDP-3-O-[3-hydroxymyristoyl] N-acetylglucosamine deacetylase
MVTLDGVGLFTGERTRVTLARRPGPAVLVKDRCEVPFVELEVISTAHTTTVGTRDRAIHLGMVEHLFAAFAAMGVRSDVVVRCEGGSELPLLDGGARRWSSAVRALEIRPREPSLVVARDAIVEVGASRYEFVRQEGVRVCARIDYDDSRIAELAEWAGDTEDFVARVAPARTFAMARDLGALPSAHVAPDTVVVLTPDAILSAGARFLPDEPVRHKLLDLIGDLYLHGGPPLGSVTAFRPGHEATHAAIQRALSDGALAWA